MTTDTQVDTAALDAWIAEHLFGMHHGRDASGSPYWDYREHLGSVDIGVLLADVHVAPPAYSTTGDGMLLVLEAMKEHSASLNLYPPSNYAKRATACYSDGSGWIPFHADTLPTAVALAAKAVLEAEAR